LRKIERTLNQLAILNDMWMDCATPFLSDNPQT
jgi:hypothetical protein